MTMYVEKRNNLYRIRPTINGKRQTINFDHKPTQKEIRETLTALENRQHVNGSSTFSDCANRMIDDKSNVLSPSTIRRYTSMLNGLSVDFKLLKLDYIANPDVQREVNQLSSKFAPKTVQNYYGFISAVFAYFRPDYTLTIKLPSKQIKPLYIPNSTDIQRLISYTKENDYAHKYLFPILCGCQGMRLGEVTALTKKDIDAKKCTISISKSKVLDKDNKWIIKKSPKTDASNRVIKVSNSTIEAFEQYGLYDGYPKSISDYMSKTQTKLGMQHFSFHKLRHYFASVALETLPVATVQEFGGWSTPSTLNRIYAHNLRSTDSVADVMNNIF